MIYKVYSVFDNAVGAYLPPMFLRSHGEAIRSFEAAALSEQHEFAKFPDSFSLFYLGDWDDSTSNFQDLALIPQPLAKAHEVIARQASAA